MPEALLNVGGKMDKLLIAKTLELVKANSPKKNFKQSIDLIINLKDIDLKKQEHQLNTFVTLHNSTKKVSVCAFVGPELEKSAKDACDETILAESFPRFKEKKEIKKLANKHDFFVAQANIMPQIATVFGRVLGPRGKMPNPKIGGILPPNANLKPLYEKLAKTVKVATRNEPVVKCMVGKEDSSPDEVADNILTVYNAVINSLPNEKHNVKNVMLKLTMGPAFAIRAQENEEGDKDRKGKHKKTEAKKSDSTTEKRESNPEQLEKEKSDETIKKPKKKTESKKKER